MRYYPVYLDIEKRPCLVVGGGRVGTRKAGTLLACGARVTVVSTDISAELAAMAADGRIQVKQRSYRTTDLREVFLVVGATSDPSINRLISDDAGKARCLCNIADAPGLSNFVLPSIVQRGDLSIAISTGGRSPAFAKHLRKELEAQFGPEYAPFLALMGTIRSRLLAAGHAPGAHKSLFEKLIQGGLLKMVAEDDAQAIDTLLNSLLGPDYRYRRLLDAGMDRD